MFGALGRALKPVNKMMGPVNKVAGSVPVMGKPMGLAPNAVPGIGLQNAMQSAAGAPVGLQRPEPVPDMSAGQIPPQVPQQANPQMNAMAKLKRGLGPSFGRSPQIY